MENFSAMVPKFDDLIEMMKNCPRRKKQFSEFVAGGALTSSVWGWRSGFADFEVLKSRRLFWGCSQI